MIIGAKNGYNIAGTMSGKVRFVLHQVGLEKEKAAGFPYNQNYKQGRRYARKDG